MNGKALHPTFLILVVILPMVTMTSNNSQAQSPQVSENAIFGISWNPNGDALAYIRKNGIVQIVDTLNQETTTLDLGTKESSYAIAYSPNGAMLAVSEGYKVHIWDTDTWETLHTLMAHTDFVIDIRWSPNSAMLVTTSFAGNSPNMIIWDATTGSAILFSGEVHLLSVAFSSDGTKLVCASDLAIRFTDADTGERLGFIGTRGQALSVDWHPVTNLIVSSTAANFVEIWNGETRANISSIEAHTDGVRRVKWSPDGTQFASASYDGTIKIWNLASQEVVRTIEVGSRVFALDWSPDGTQIAYGTEDGTFEIVLVEDIPVP